MRIFKRILLKHKIILLILAVSFVTTLFAVTILMFNNIQKHKQKIIENSIVEAKLTAEYSVSPLVFDFPNEALRVLKTLNTIEDVDMAYVFNLQGEIFAKYSKDSLNSYNISGIKKEREHYILESEGKIWCYQPVFYKGEFLGGVLLITKIQLANEIKETLISMIYILASLLALAFLMANVFHKYISRPILRLAEFASDISRNRDYSKRLQIELDDEIGVLIRDFNAMLAQIQMHDEAREEAQRELKALNEQLEQRVLERTSELEYVNNELKDFAYITSHDLKSPLRGISQVTQWIMQDYSSKFDSGGIELLNLLQERVTRMNKLIDNILEYSRIGRKEENSVKIDLNKLVEDVVSIINIPEGFNVQVTNKLPELVANRTRIEQVFLNLINNAIKHNDKKEGIVFISSVEDKNYIQINFQDNGPGIPEKYHKKIFGMFQTLSNNQNTDSTGVGLAIVKKVADLYKGSVWVESKEGEGAKFCIKIPKQK